MRKTREADAAFIARLFDLPHARGFVHPVTAEQVRESLSREHHENYLVEHDGEPAGNVLLRNHGFLIEIGQIVVAPPRAGAGTFALAWVLNRAFDELGAHRVFLETVENNIPMRRLAERLGFVQEGLYRDGFQDARTGEFKNLCPYGLLEAEYRARLH